MCLDSLRLPSCARNPHISSERSGAQQATKDTSIFPYSLPQPGRCDQLQNSFTTDWTFAASTSSGPQKIVRSSDIKQDIEGIVRHTFIPWMSFSFSTLVIILERRSKYIAKRAGDMGQPCWRTLGG
ncbi:hypothetical protein M9H77_09624 [Catharanthus roseus]|uniref:Uncharacterized protein n=1 Tax=Catharanthus roseus TaxID=4058 RepID=A0ACC0C1H3_CATRO|nr:hypothetical protein M9H77_09624 [Catharanthus roseus]